MADRNELEVRFLITLVAKLAANLKYRRPPSDRRLSAPLPEITKMLRREQLGLGVELTRKWSIEKFKISQ